MTYNLYINVTQQDINNGKQADCYKCPIALAVNRCLKPDYHADIGSYKGININYSDRNIPQYAIHVNEQLLSFITDFDKGMNVEPFVFVLPNLDERYIANLA